MIEYAIWGIPPEDMRRNEDIEEDLLKTGLFSQDEVQTWKEFLTGKGCTALRVQTINLAEPFDAAKAFVSAIEKE